jgi:hypothetical protein
LQQGNDAELKDEVGSLVNVTTRAPLLFGFTVVILLFALSSAPVNSAPEVCLYSQAAVLGAVSPDAGNQDYTWPLKGRYALTSTFAEYRHGHYHAGLDISTGGRTGAPVRAAASGYVARVRVSPFGYGKALYVKQDDDRYAVYAHLEKLDAKISASVRRKQYSTGQYEVEIYPGEGEFPIKQGDVIGYSGRSGCVAPHLHFELRDGSNRPINPLIHGVSVSDRRAPHLVAVCVYPVGLGSTVNGQPRPCVMKLERAGKQNAYRAQNKVRVDGKFAVSAYVRDEQDPDSYPLGPYRLETFLDDERVFATEMARFSYEKTHDVDVAFDRRLALLGEGRFLRQFALAGTELEVHAYTGPAGGIMDASGWNKLDGTAAHTIKFVARDAAGNRSEAALEVFRNDEPVIRGTLASLEEDVLHLEAMADDPDGTVARVHFKIWKEAAEVVARTSATSTDTGTFVGSIKLPGSSTSSHLMVEAVAEDDGGVMSKPTFAALHAKAQHARKPFQLAVSGEWHENVLFLTVKSNVLLKSPPVLDFTRDSPVPTQIETTMRTPYTAHCAYWPELGLNGTLKIRARAADLNGRVAEATWSANVHTVKRATSGSARYGDTLRVNFPKNGVYRPMFARVEPVENPGRTEIPFISEAYRIEPHDEPLDEKAEINFLLNEETSLQGAGIYLKNSKGEWGYVATEVDEKAKLVAASTRELGVYAVLRDTVAPRISAIRPRNGSTVRSATPTIGGRVEDVGSGIAYKTITVHLDDELIICEYDPFQNSISYLPDKALAKGKHTVSISLSDYAGNASRATSSFTVR